MSAAGAVGALRRPLPRPRLAVRLPRVGVAAGCLVLAVVLTAVLFPETFTSRDPDAVHPTQALLHPGAAHWFGTDRLGRDVYSRVVYGARPSVEIGLGATAFAVVVGSLLGVFAATAGRVVDEAVMRATDVFLAFPGLLLALLVVAVLGPSTANATLAIGASLAPGFVRLARAQALVVRESDYVRAAVVAGRGRVDVFFRHLLPNALPPVLVLATVNTGAAVIAGSSLSFLGMGPKPPAPEWGAMLADGRDFLDTDWTLAFLPGAALTLTVVSVTVVGRALRRRFEGGIADGRH